MKNGWRGNRALMLTLGFLSLAAGLTAGAVKAVAIPAAEESADHPFFTTAQVMAGSKAYTADCASCHGEQLQGSVGPALTGAGFMQLWAGGQRSVADLFNLIRGMMPMQAPGSLTETQYQQVVAFVLSQNGFKPGDAALTSQNMGVKLLASASTGASTVETRDARPAVFPGEAKYYGAATTAKPDDAQLLKGGDTNWFMYNKDYSGQRYSDLKQINASNAKHLTPTCVFQAGEVGSFQAAPIVYDGLMYITTPWNTFALNPATCQKIWENDYAGTTPAPVSLTRGVALYRGKVFRTTPNGHFVALDAKTGKLLWDVWMSDPLKGYWLSASPIAYDGKVVIGEAGADWGANSHIYAFDTETGKRVWTFDVIPSGNEPGADSWKEGAEHGGGSLWSTFALNPKTGLLFAAIGNPSPDYNGAMRPGDNLYTDSVVALNAKTGKLSWYAQQVPHDLHDWDTAAAPALYEDGGKSLLAVVNKGGWLYIYDRDTHKLVSQEEISSHLNIDKPLSTNLTRVCPGIIGGAEWNGPAYSPLTHSLFINSVDWCGGFKLTETRFLLGSSYFGGSYVWDEPEAARGWIRSVDAATGKLIWERKVKTPMLAALTPTAGNVVFTGNLDGDFMVLDAKTGDTLYRFNTGGAVAGAASTYLVDGKQYIAETSGNASRSVWHTTGAMTVFVFALPSKG